MASPCIRLVVICVAALLLTCSAADAFIGIIGGGKGKGACETEGGLCFTQDACCEDFTCEKASQATYGGCTSSKPQLTGNHRGSGSECESDADCPAGQCCSQEGAGRQQLCRTAGTSGCSGQSAENLFQQYYSGLFRKRGSSDDS